MEPVVSKGPIFAGPEGSARFVEVDELISSGDLRLVHSDSEFVAIMEEGERAESPSSPKSDKGIKSHQHRLGGTSDLLSVLFGA